MSCEIQPCNVPVTLLAIFLSTSNLINLKGVYTRSFTYHSNKFYFASTQLGIVVAELVKDGVGEEMTFLKVVEVPGEMEYLNDIYFSNERRVYVTWAHKNR